MNQQNELLTYVASYSQNDRSYGFYVKASSFEDARAKLKAFKETAKIDGQLDTVVGVQDCSIYEQPEVNNHFFEIEDTVL